ncbi:MAG: hypothetical protein ABJA98_22785 [Acidobacteriota bacterium]
MAFAHRSIAVTWLTAVGVLALTLAATLWKRAADTRRVKSADADDLIRMDSDMG